MCILFIYLPFSAIFSVYFFVILPSSPIQGLEPGATPAVVGVVLLLSSRTAAAGNKNT